MSEDHPEEAPTIHDMTRKGREKLAQAQERAKSTLGAVTAYIRANPWVAVAGAAAIGGVLVAVSRQGNPGHRKLDVVREWLDEAYAKLPDQKQVQSMAGSV